MVVGTLEHAEVAGSPERLSQLVRNLVRNAVQAAGAEGGFAGRSRRTDQEICLTVRDRGPGIPPNEVAHLFERFYTRRKQGGTGVGLSVAQQIAAQHGGQISVTSALGEGSCFTLALPSLGAQLGAEDEVLGETEAAQRLGFSGTSQASLKTVTDSGSVFFA